MLIDTGNYYPYDGAKLPLANFELSDVSHCHRAVTCTDKPSVVAKDCLSCLEKKKSRESVDCLCRLYQTRLMARDMYAVYLILMALLSVCGLWIVGK